MEGLTNFDNVDFHQYRVSQTSISGNSPKKILKHFLY